jgi:predicted ribosomally synthesized peptide with nif11-like leader
MTKENAQDFLKHMSSDPETAQKVVDEYKKLLQDLAREKGFEFTEAELVEAARALKDAAAGEISNAALDMVVGGAPGLGCGLMESNGIAEGNRFGGGKGFPI